MKSVYPRCAGLDAHKKFVVAYSLSTSAAAAPVQVIHRFSTKAADLKSLAA
jgi:hypothetical protein